MPPSFPIRKSVVAIWNCWLLRHWKRVSCRKPRTPRKPANWPSSNTSWKICPNVPTAPIATWCTRLRASPTISSHRPRSQKSQNSISVRVRLHVNRRVASKTCAPFPGASHGVNAACSSRAGTVLAAQCLAGWKKAAAKTAPRNWLPCAPCAKNGHSSLPCSRIWTWCSPKQIWPWRRVTRDWWLTASCAMRFSIVL